MSFDEYGANFRIKNNQTNEICNSSMNIHSLSPVRYIAPAIITKSISMPSIKSKYLLDL